MLKVGLKGMWDIKVKKGTAGKKGKPGKPPKFIKIYGVVAYNEEEVDKYHSVWRHVNPPPQIIQLLADSGYGGLNLLLTFLVSAGFTQDKKDAPRVQVYSPGEMNKIIGNNRKG